MRATPDNSLVTPRPTTMPMTMRIWGKASAPAARVCSAAIAMAHAAEAPPVQRVAPRVLAVLMRLCHSPNLKQKIPLRHWQHGGRLAGQELAVSADLVRLRVHLDTRRGIVEHHGMLAYPAARVLDGDHLLVDAEFR